MSKTLRQYYDEQPAKGRIIFPLDVPTVPEAIAWVDKLSGHVGMFKLGFEFQQRILESIISPAVSLAEVTNNVLLIRELFDKLAGNIFWDGKFHDIPNTVGGASKAVAGMGVKMFNVHASGDVEALREAVANRGNAYALGVTVLTSIESARCGHIYGMANIPQVIDFVDIICDAGAHGVICSPLEVGPLREISHFNHLALITPAVRPVFASIDDQKRVMTPAEAMAAGSDALVIGRPISKHADPIEAACLCAEEIQKGLDAR